MKRSEMTCSRCVNCDRLENSNGEVVHSLCTAHPEPRPIVGAVGVPGGEDFAPAPENAIRADPQYHHCAEGCWREWDPKYKQWEAMSWNDDCEDDSDFNALRRGQAK